STRRTSTCSTPRPPSACRDRRGRHLPRGGPLAGSAPLAPPVAAPVLAPRGPARPGAAGAVDRGLRRLLLPAVPQPPELGPVREPTQRRLLRGRRSRPVPGGAGQRRLPRGPVAQRAVRALHGPRR